ncbi:hypothetical protein [Motilibacter deserti]|uniref:Uncharacterized protein n=1 Tax=Motilibacter deserti TaxID=2714956 RepID=A0ABX0GW05_9ACTN|nr:hypothetical protein [Motilibacter deserti]NHC15147.1 hypothetical protein [Motilibacter deserti]
MQTDTGRRERALLEALLERHGQAWPVTVLVAVSRAAAELPHHLAVAGEPAVDAEADLSDALGAINATRMRLARLASSRAAVSTATGCARAARLLGEAQRFLRDEPC